MWAGIRTVCVHVLLSLVKQFFAGCEMSGAVFMLDLFQAGLHWHF
jgi:hypothetical protein